MGEHTKGPWHWDEDVKDIGEINGPSGGMVAFVYPFVSIRTSEEFNGALYCHADARLIAAAPELLEALEGLADIEDKSFADNCYCACCGEHPAHGQPFGGHADNCALVAARLAIAKARGTDGHVRQRREP